MNLVAEEYVCIFISQNDAFACSQGKKEVSFEVLVCFNNLCRTASIKMRENTISNGKGTPNVTNTGGVSK